MQGLTFNDKQSELFIADYLKGILRINIANPSERNWLEFPVNATKKGIDGLLWYNKTLLAIHNGAKPIRVVQYFLNDGNEILSAKVLDNNRPEFNEPALGTVVGNKFYFFANAPTRKPSTSRTSLVSYTEEKSNHADTLSNFIAHE